LSLSVVVVNTSRATGAVRPDWYGGTRRQRPPIVRVGPLERCVLRHDRDVAARCPVVIESKTVTNLMAVHGDVLACGVVRVADGDPDITPLDVDSGIHYRAGAIRTIRRNSVGRSEGVVALK